MATIVTVHGTFAHAGQGAAGTAAEASDLQWWQPGSTFDLDMRELLDARADAGTGKLEVTHFKWSGDNSETARRAAGRKLFDELKKLDATGESYAVVGHSHGGSVIGWALLEAAARKHNLPGLKRWVTVGTPFVAMRKERLLFQRLDLLRKVIFVASFMLLLMFLVYIVAEMLTGGRMLFGATFPTILLVVGTMMSLPIIVFYLVLRYLDGLGLLHYRRAVRKRASEWYAGRWLSLTHTDDEAVQGLAFLPGAKLDFFDKHFAVSAITGVSVLAVPLLYLVALTSPTVMLGIGHWLQTKVYEVGKYPAAEQALREMNERFRASRVAARDETERREMWRSYRQARKELEERFEDAPKAARALRFRQRFFEHEGRPCEGGQLCGSGRDLRINSGLLLHLVTDELSWAIGGGDLLEGRQGWVLRLAIPALLVPVIFGLLSLLLMLLIRSIASVVSHGASKLLNSITNAEVKRAAFGNDTQGEVAVGAVDRPAWIERSQPRLPDGLGDIVTGYSNGIASNSLAKFRRAIGQLASVEPKHTADTAITTYFTWKELVHASYFDVPEFRKVVACSLSRADGFAPSPRFEADRDYARAAQWLAEIEGTPGTKATPAEAAPTDVDRGAVAAVVASTVKHDP